MEDVGFDRLGVFTYSAEDGTPAEHPVVSAYRTHDEARSFARDEVAPVAARHDADAVATLIEPSTARTVLSALLVSKLRCVSRR